MDEHQDYVADAVRGHLADLEALSGWPFQARIVEMQEKAAQLNRDIADGLARLQNNAMRAQKLREFLAELERQHG